MNSPRVTVCVPVRNGSRTIRRTLDSILGQDYPNFEVIVSDNCSTDDTARIVEEYTKRGVKYCFNSKLDTWGESNWNYVLSLAEGPFIALYHADDIYTPTMVRRQIEFLQTHPDVSSVFTMTQMIDDKDRPIRMGRTRLPQKLQGRTCFEFPLLLDAVLKYSNFMVVPTLMTRRETLDEVGVFNHANFHSAADLDLWLRMARWRPVGIIDAPLHHYRVSAQQGSALLNRERTKLADIFGVLDYYVRQPGVRAMVQPQSLALYELQRANDQALCAMNLLAQGKVAEGRVRLREALHWRRCATAFVHPRWLMNLMVGSFLLVSTYVGLGSFVGQQVNRAYTRRNAWRRKPVALAPGRD